jgi:branched-chain amino acid transport system permease protein
VKRVDLSPGAVTRRLLRRDTTSSLLPSPPVFRRHQYAEVVAFMVAVGVILPLLVTSDANEYRVNLWLAYSMAALGFYWVFGLGGRFAFCQTFMMAVGGYTSAWVTHKLGPGWFLLGLVAAMAVCALLAAAVGLLTARAQDFYFAIATLAITEIGLVIFQKGGGPFGPDGTVTSITIPQIAGHQILSNRATFYLFLVILGLLLIVGAFIDRSPLRRLSIAARDNGPVAATLGVPVIRLQVTLFMLGSAVGGLSGALIGHWNGVTEANSFGIELSIGIFLMLLLGGLGSMWGPVVGAAFYVGIPQVLNGLDKYEAIVYGGLLLIVVIAVPQGIVNAFARTFVAGLRVVRRPPALSGGPRGGNHA